MKSVDTECLLLAILGFSIPFAGYNIETNVISLSVTNGILLLTAGYILWNRMHERTLYLSKFDIFITTSLAGILVFGLAGTVVMGGSFRWVPTVVGWMLLLGVITVGITSRRNLLVFLHALFLAAVVISILTIISSIFRVDLSPGLQAFFAPRSAFGIEIPFIRARGVSLSFGESGMFVMGIFPLYVLYAVTRRTWRTILGIGVISFAVIFIYQSRSTWLAMFVSLNILFFSHPIRSWLPERYDIAYRRFRLASFVAIPFVTLGLAIVFINIGGSIWARLDQIITSVEIITTNPLFGVGWGPENRVLFDGALPHNAFLRLGVSLGAISFLFSVVSMAAVIILYIRMVINTDGEEYLFVVGLFAGFVAVLVEINFLTGFGKTGWLWVGILMSTFKIVSSESESP